MKLGRAVLRCWSTGWQGEYWWLCRLGEGGTICLCTGPWIYMVSTRGGNEDWVEDAQYGYGCILIMVMKIRQRGCTRGHKMCKRKKSSECGGGKENCG